jgi:type IV pilus assembly protein PilV
MRKSPRAQIGMTLIEVLLAVLLFSLAVLGMVAMQARATQISSDAEDRNRAALLANEAVSLLWQYVPTQGATPSTIPAGVLAAWQAEVASPQNSAAASSGLLGLPGGVGTITQSAANPNIWIVLITWTPPDRNATNSAGVAQYETQVVINYP